MREADGQFTHRLVWHVAPVLCASFPFFLGYVVVLVCVVPVGKFATPVLRVEGFRVRGILGEHLENDRATVWSAHDGYIVEDVHGRERAPCALLSSLMRW